MKWDLAWGPQIDFLNSIWRSTGKPPKPLLERPQIDPRWVSLYNAFRRLSAGRQYSEGGPQALSIGEVLAYCELLGIVGYDARDFILHIVQTLDSEWIEHKIRAMQGKRKADTAKK